MNSASTLPATMSSVLCEVITANQDDTLSDIARRFNLGYEEIVSANPHVDPWLPRAGTKIVIPTQFVLPDAPRQGIVINLAAMRLFYYPKAKPGEPQKVITHQVGIGRVEWKTAKLKALVDGEIDGEVVFKVSPLKQLTASIGGIISAGVSGDLFAGLPKGRIPCVIPALNEAVSALGKAGSTGVATVAAQAKFAAFITTGG